jgi:integrative and conjugative element protein (TIGR02256 family)
MHLVTGWFEPKTGRLVSIDMDVVKQTASFWQKSSNATEAGGLLMGLRRWQNLEVKWLTFPQETDKRQRSGFIREIDGHAAAAIARWRETGAQADYVGEWHTHPEEHPNPSGIDLSEWSRLSTARADGRPLFFLIVGTESSYAALCQGDALLPMVPIEFAA